MGLLTILLAASLNVVCVTWEDAATHPETWITEEELVDLEIPIVISCGILVKETEERVYLAMDVDAETGENYLATIGTIPRGMVKEIRQLGTIDSEKKPHTP